MWIRRLERLTEKVAVAAGSFLSRHRGRVEDIARQMGGALLAPQMEQQCLKRFFGDRCDVDRWQDLMKVTKEGVPVGANTGWDLRQELAYDNHRSVQKYDGEMLRKAMADVGMGWLMVFKVEDAERI